MVSPEVQISPQSKPRRNTAYQSYAQLTSSIVASQVPVPFFVLRVAPVVVLLEVLGPLKVLLVSVELELLEDEPSEAGGLSVPEVPPFVDPSVFVPPVVELPVVDPPVLDPP